MSDCGTGSQGIGRRLGIKKFKNRSWATDVVEALDWINETKDTISGFMGCASGVGDRWFFVNHADKTVSILMLLSGGNEALVPAGNFLVKDDKGEVKPWSPHFFNEWWEEIT